MGCFPQAGGSEYEGPGEDQVAEADKLLHPIGGNSSCIAGTVRGLQNIYHLCRVLLQARASAPPQARHLPLAGRQP